MLLFEIINNIFREDTMVKNQSISAHFHSLSDPGRDNKRHQFLDIITIAICAVISNADSFEHQGQRM